MELLPEIPCGSLLSRKFYFLFFIICIVLCYSWIKNQISLLLHAVQQSWVDERELEYISVPGFFIPCSLCCFGSHLKSLHLFWLLSEIKKFDKTAEILDSFSFSFILQKHLSVIFCYTRVLSQQRLHPYLCVKGKLPPLCRWAGNRNQTLSLLSFLKQLVGVLE